MLTIGIFAKNESQNLVDTCKNVLKVFEGNNIIQFEIIVYDDGSSISNNLIYQYLNSNRKKIKYFKNSTNRGIAYSTKFIAQKAKYDYILLIPGDNTYESNELAKVVDTFKKNQCEKTIIGVRYHGDLRGRARSVAAFIARNSIAWCDISKFPVPNYILILTKKSLIHITPENLRYGQGTFLLGAIFLNKSEYVEIKIQQIFNSAMRSKSIRISDVLSILRANAYLLILKNKINKIS